MLANLFMGHHEKIWLDNYGNSKPLEYKRYVDDIFCLFNNEEEAHMFLEYLNKQHPNIKFTPEPKNNGKLPFLDINIIQREEGVFSTSIYHKESYTGLLTNYTSLIPASYKLALIKTLIHRVFNICNTWKLFSKNITELEETLKRNSFPPKIISREINKYLNKTFNKDNTPKHENVIYYKLPYLGKISKDTQIKLRELCEIFCKKTDITLSYMTCKIGSFLSSKSKPLPNLKSFVVYYYCCSSCEASYVGRTKRHFSVRVDEHLRTDKTSHIYQHINKNKECKANSNETSFKIIDKGATEYNNIYQYI